MAHERVRGAMGSCVQLMVVTGIMGVYIAGTPQMSICWQHLDVMIYWFESHEKFYMPFVYCIWSADRIWQASDHVIKGLSVLYNFMTEVTTVVIRVEVNVLMMGCFVQGTNHHQKLFSCNRYCHVIIITRHDQDSTLLTESALIFAGLTSHRYA